MAGVSMTLYADPFKDSRGRLSRRDRRNLRRLLRGLLFAMLASFLAGALALAATAFIGREHSPRLKGLWGQNTVDEQTFSQNVSSCPGACFLSICNTFGAHKWRLVKRGAAREERSCS